MTTPCLRRDVALGVMRDYQVLRRRACVLIAVDPKTVLRECLPDHGAIRGAMQEIAGQRRRFGYRRIGVMMERKGMSMNHKKLYRLYREEGLSVRRRRNCKRGQGSRTPVPGTLRPNDRWSMDFVADMFGASRTFRISAIKDDCCRAGYEHGHSGLQLSHRKKTEIGGQAIGRAKRQRLWGVSGTAAPSGRRTA